MPKYASDFTKLLISWVGKNESDGSHREIIDIYNSHKPRSRGYKLKYSDPWCAGTMSAAAIKCGMTSIIPIECSCNYMIEKAKLMGIWRESDSLVPAIGDMVVYDWDDSGIGDNKGYPEHIGAILYVNREENTLSVIEGNYDNAVKVRTLKINGRYIRGFICPKYDAAIKPTGNKTISQIALEVIRGKWGNGAERKKRLTEAGYDYAAIQKKVNDLID